MPVANTNRYESDGKTVRIVTRRGEVILIDSEDEATARLHCWAISSGYARAVTRISGRLVNVYLHRLICVPTADRPHVDHISGVKTDNRRSNLRRCDRSENLSNQKIRSDSRTGVKGVGLHSQTGKYRARVRKKGSVLNLGLFQTIAAAEAVVRAARTASHGEFARHE